MMFETLRHAGALTKDSLLDIRGPDILSFYHRSLSVPELFLL